MSLIIRDGQKRDVARRLRQSSTEAERAVWRLLRDRRRIGLKFRRQVPIGPFVADFACVTLRLAVEIDGGQHADSRSDAKRDAVLVEMGWRVVRIWNNEALENPEGTLLRILEAAGIALE